MSSPEMKSGIPANLLIIQIIRNLRGCFSVSCFSLFVWFIKLIFLKSKVEKSEEWWLTLWLTLQSGRQVHNSVFGSPLSALCSQRPGKFFFQGISFIAKVATKPMPWICKSCPPEGRSGEWERRRQARPPSSLWSWWCSHSGIWYYALLSWLILAWKYDIFYPHKLTLLPQICIFNWET